MAFCSNCGNQLSGNEKFCAQCGQTVSAGTAAPAPTPMAMPMPPTPPLVQPVATAPVAFAAPPVAPAGVAVPPAAQPAAQKKGMMGTVILVVIVAGLGYYYYNRIHPKPPAPVPQPAPQPSPNPALVNQQSFNAQWQNESGMLVLTTAKWNNNSTTDLASATVQCEQYDAIGTDLSQYRVTLNGPTPANTWSSYSNIRIGAIANRMTKVNCSIVHVKTQ